MMASNPEQPAASVEEDVSAFPSFRLQRALIDLTDPNDQDMLEQSALDAFVAIEDIARIVAREEIRKEVSAALEISARLECGRPMSDTINALRCNRLRGHSGGCSHAFAAAAEPQPKPAASEPRMMAANPAVAVGVTHWTAHPETVYCTKYRPPCQPLPDAAPTDVTATDATRAPTIAAANTQHPANTPPEEPVAVTSSSPDPKPQPHRMVDFHAEPHMNGAIHYEIDECKAWHCQPLPNVTFEPPDARRINTVRLSVRLEPPKWANARDLAILLAGLDALAELPQVREDLAATNTECDALRARLAAAGIADTHSLT